MLQKSILILGDYAWVGLNDIAEEGEFVWTDSSTKTYANFQDNEPNNQGGNEDCVGLHENSNGKYVDIPCLKNERFICETNYNLFNE